MLNIVILDGHTLNPGDLDWSVLDEFGQVTVYNHTDYADIVNRSKEAHILVVNKAKIDHAIIEQLPKLRHVALTATGFDNVDMAALKSSGKTASNVRNYGSDTVAQHAFALILELTNHVALNTDAVQAGEWNRSIDFCFWKKPIIELSGKTLGIVGWGNIGQKAGKIGQAFGMHVITSSLKANDDTNVQQVSIEALFRTSDFISLHTHLNSENTAFVNTRLLSMMKPTAFLINTSRGALIDEYALRDALLSGTIAGAGLDVLSVEPPVEGNVLMGLPHCVITPHQAWASFEARQRMMMMLKENIAAFLNGKPLNLID